MKKQLLVVIALLGIVYLNAQNQGTGAIRPSKVQTDNFTPNNNNTFRSLQYVQTGYRTDDYYNGWIPSDSALYLNNTAGLDTNNAEYWYNIVDSTWSGHLRTLAIYNANGNMHSQTRQAFENNSWANKVNLINTYNGNNQKLTELTQWWNGASNSWLNTSLLTFGFDGNHYVNSELQQSWDTGTHTWINGIQYIDVNDANGNVLTETGQSWIANAWFNNYKVSTTYLPPSHLTQQIMQTWNGGTQTWVNASKTQLFLDANYNDTASINYNWNAQNTTWVPMNKSTRTYNQANSVLINTQYFYNADSANFTPLSQTIATYDINNNRATYQSNSWNDVSSTFQPVWLTVSVYDSNFNNTYDLSLRSDSLGTPPQQVWDSATQTFYYYQQYNVTTGVPQVLNNLGASLYPNPTTGNFTLTLNAPVPMPLALYIYDATGRLIATETLLTATGKNNIALSYPNLPTGNYLLKAVDRSTQKASVLQWVKY